MRAHIEPVVLDDLVPHEAELPGGTGTAWQRNLSYDEENGAATTWVRFDTDWRRPGGFHSADTEWYVLTGAVTLGADRLGAGGYWRAPSGLRVPEVTAAAGTTVLVFRDHATQEFTFSAVDRNALLPLGVRSRSGRPAALTVVDAADLAWQANALAGDCGPHAKVGCKVLFQDPPPTEEPGLGASTLLLRYPAGWTNHQFEHHSCAQEVYVVTGRLEYNFGFLAPGWYVHRPPLVKHGDVRVGTDDVVALVRFSGVPEHWITEEPTVDQLGTPVNWDPDDAGQSPVIAGIPQRTASVGPWSGFVR